MKLLTTETHFYHLRRYLYIQSFQDLAAFFFPEYGAQYFFYK